MIILRQLYTALTYRPVFFLVLLVAAYLIQVVLAQEPLATEEPTLVQSEMPTEVTATPTEVVLLPIEIMASPEPTLPAPTLMPIPPEPIIVETTIPTLMVEELPTSVVPETSDLTLIVEVSPTSTLPVSTTPTPIVEELPTSVVPETSDLTLIVEVSPTSTLPVSTTPTLILEELPTLTPIEPVIFPTALLTPAGIAITASTTHLPQSTVLSASITTESLLLPKHFMLTCLTDSTVLSGIWSVPGDLLANDAVKVSDSGFQVNGQWQLMGQYKQSVPETPSTGLLWTLNYEVLGSDLTSLLCWLQEVDDNGQLHSIPILPVELFVEVGVSNIPLSPTVDVNTPLPTPFVLSLSGNVSSDFPLDEIVITVTREGFDGMSMVSDGAFTFDLPPGDYQLTVNAPHHIGFALDVTVSEQPVMLPTIILIGANVEANGTSTIADIDLISLYYGLAVPPAPASVDLNGDGLINLYDLTLAGAGIYYP